MRERTPEEQANIDATPNGEMRLRICEAYIWTGRVIAAVGFVSLMQLDHGPLSPISSCELLGLGIVTWIAGEAMRDKVLGIKRDDRGNRI